MRKQYFFALSVAFFSICENAHATDCTLQTPTENAFVPGYVDHSQGAGGETSEVELTKYKNPINEDYPASSFPSVEIGSVVGSDLVYSGTSNPGALLHGVNRNWPSAQEVLVFPKLFFTSQWAPSGREYCSKHKTKRNQARVCVEKQIAYDPTYVTVQLTNEGSKVIYEKRFLNLNSFNNTELKFPAIVCPGPLNNFDIVVRNFEGGTANFRVHRVSFFGAYR